MSVDTVRTDLFISYAWENAPVAQWVARKLIACGYHVWMDRLKLYGGCSWPDDIDDAIKHKAIRMIHILSRTSISKTNPKNELQLGYMLSQKIPGFLIPLNIDGIPPIELPWQMPAIQFIDFREWDRGFSDLIKALEVGGCPRFDVDDGARRAIESYMPNDAVLEKPERIYSNVFRFTKIPSVIKKFRTQMPLLRDEFDALTKGWPAWYVSNYESLAFSEPPAAVLKASRYELIEEYPIANCVEISGVRVYNICKRLLEKSIRALAFSAGFVESKGDLVFPTLAGGKKFFIFKSYDGVKLRIQPHGYKTVRGTRINYSLGFRPSVVRVDEAWHVVISLRISMTDNSGRLVDAAKIPSYRKAVVSSWWNWEWFLRHMAVSAALGNESGEWLLQLDKSQAVGVSALPESGMSLTSIDDERVSELSRERSAKNCEETSGPDIMIGKEGNHEK